MQPESKLLEWILTPKHSWSDYASDVNYAANMSKISQNVIKIRLYCLINL